MVVMTEGNDSKLTNALEFGCEETRHKAEGFGPEDWS